MGIKGHSCLISVCIYGRKRGSTIVVVQMGLALILHTFDNVTEMACKEKLVVFILKKSHPIHQRHNASLHEKMKFFNSIKSFHFKKKIDIIKGAFQVGLAHRKCSPSFYRGVMGVRTPQIKHVHCSLVTLQFEVDILHWSLCGLSNICLR